MTTSEVWSMAGLLGVGAGVGAGAVATLAAGVGLAALALVALFSFLQPTKRSPHRSKIIVK